MYISFFSSNRMLWYFDYYSWFFSVTDRPPARIMDSVSSADNNNQTQNSTEVCATLLLLIFYWRIVKIAELAFFLSFLCYIWLFWYFVKWRWHYTITQKAIKIQNSEIDIDIPMQYSWWIYKALQYHSSVQYL